MMNPLTQNCAPLLILKGNSLNSIGKHALYVSASLAHVCCTNVLACACVCVCAYNVVNRVHSSLCTQSCVINLLIIHV